MHVGISNFYYMVGLCDCLQYYLLVNVNSRSRSLYAIARPSDVCNARAPYLDGSNFRQYFYGIMYRGFH